MLTIPKGSNTAFNMISLMLGCRLPTYSFRGPSGFFRFSALAAALTGTQRGKYMTCKVQPCLCACTRWDAVMWLVCCAPVLLCHCGLQHYGHSKQLLPTHTHCLHNTTSGTVCSQVMTHTHMYNTSEHTHMHNTSEHTHMYNTSEHTHMHNTSEHTHMHSTSEHTHMHNTSDTHTCTCIYHWTELAT